MGVFSEIAIIEVLDIWWVSRIDKFGVRCFMEHAEETVLWMSPRQFYCFRRQCEMHCREGIYARYCYSRFEYTVFGAEIDEVDYRLVQCFDMTRKVLIRPVPPVLLIPEKVEIHESLRDLY